ncbi:hypothetical protein [Microbulbifer taiwanensis]|uniref:Lipoprotein n=1 Tax=Microbulbifer taiwanensis TaxID=986746 RepID=A0ABW1YJS4_9GAMM|nr:hypothetical protein [Microbulbifer taiwanensis]
MKKVNHSLGISILSALLLSAGCASERVVEVSDPGCDYTQVSYNHVFPRHCVPSTYPYKSKFMLTTTDYCNGVPEGQSLCETVQSDYDRRTVQSDGNLCYDKDMGVVVGTNSEKWVRLVVDKSGGRVVTLFPENSAGCR